MFGGKFAYTKFDTRVQSFDIPIDFIAKERIGGSFGLGINFPISFSAREKIYNTAIILYGLPINYELSEDINCNAAIVANIVINESYDEVISNHTIIGKDILAGDDFKEELNNITIVGSDIFISEEYYDELNNTTIIGADMPISANLSEIIHCVTSANILDRDVFKVNTCIPAGGELRVDTHPDVFSVLLNGSNIYHFKDGKFFTIDRETVDIKIEHSTTGKLKGFAVFEEKYL